MLRFEDLKDILTEEEYAAAEKARIPSKNQSFHNYANLMLHTFAWNKTPGFSPDHWKNKHTNLFLLIR
jgi:hypothetical protein